MIVDSLICSRWANYEGKCELCRAKDRKAFIKSQDELREKRNAEYSKIGKAVERAAAMNTLDMTIREAQKGVDSEISDTGSTAATTPEETSASSAKLLEQRQPPSRQYDESASPSIKVENDDGTFCYEKYMENKWLESAREAGQITKKQRTGEAGIGSWIPFKGVEVNSRDENGDKAGSATNGAASEAHAKTESSESAIGIFLESFSELTSGAA
jgi:hypothetical protein